MKPHTMQRPTLKAGRGDVLTIGDVARVCGVAPRTATGWFDGGLLKGWRIPGCLDRRVSREEFVRFLKENRMPIPGWLDADPRAVLLVASASPLLALTCPDGWRVLVVPTLFAAGMHVRRARAALWDFSLGRAACVEAAASLVAACEREEGAACPLLLALPNDDEPDAAGLALVFDHVLAPGDDLGEILPEAGR